MCDIDNISTRINEIFDNSMPVDNATAKAEVQSLCSKIVVDDAYVKEKVTDILSLTNSYFSARKHKNFPGGADGIIRYIITDLNNIKSRFTKLNEEI